jgi:hypothetical protein
MSNSNEKAITEAFQGTMLEISNLLGDPNPNNWTKDSILNRIREIQEENGRYAKIAKDHIKKSKQVKELGRKLKKQIRESVPIAELLNDLSLRLGELDRGGLGKYEDDESYNADHHNRKGRVSEVGNLIGSLHGKERMKA